MTGHHPRRIILEPTLEPLAAKGWFQIGVGADPT